MICTSRKYQEYRVPVPLGTIKINFQIHMLILQIPYFPVLTKYLQTLKSKCLFQRSSEINTGNDGKEKHEADDFLRIFSVEYGYLRVPAD
jgi:hypothetical protein